MLTLNVSFPKQGSQGKVGSIRRLVFVPIKHVK